MGKRRRKYLTKIFVCLRSFERNIRIVKNMIPKKTVNIIKSYMNLWEVKVMMIEFKRIKSCIKLPRKLELKRINYISLFD
jgi:hypothetical protein